ncbi:MAG: hypothetical protein WBO06_11085 [Gammaproteobacteria bacterium]
MGENMIKQTVVAVACVLPSAAFASDPTALYYFMALQGFSWIWPFVLPLFFLRGARSRLRLYIVLLILPLGILELMDLPWSILWGIAAWGIYDFPGGLPSYVVVGRHVVAICLSLWFLPRFRRLVLNGIDSGPAARQSAATDRPVAPHGG